MSARHAVLLAVLMFPTLALGQQQLEGLGRITIEPGWRFTPNDHLAAAAIAAGTPLDHRSPGGPTLFGSFGYSATESIELAIDLFLGAEQLQFQGQTALTSVTYGGAVGVRLQTGLGPFLFAQNVVPRLGVFTGPTLIDVIADDARGTTEVLTAGYLANVGISFHLDDRWAISLDYRLLLARGTVPNVGSVNGGGSWVSIGLTYLIAAEAPKADSLMIH